MVSKLFLFELSLFIDRLVEPIDLQRALDEEEDGEEPGEHGDAPGGPREGERRNFEREGCNDTNESEDNTDEEKCVHNDKLIFETFSE